MSILSNLIKVGQQLLSTLLSRSCAICGKPLNGQHRYICLRCMTETSLTGFIDDPLNLMLERCWDLCPYIEHASALLLYTRKSRWSNKIHAMKYYGEWYHGEYLGEWLGVELARSGFYREVDTVIALPLHPIKSMSRGYNQSDLIAHGVAKQMGTRVIRGAVKRRRNNPPQVSVSRNERWANAENLFSVVSPERLTGRNILLVDDVFTTGATVISCAEEILSSVDNCRIWIATIAASEREFGVESRGSR